MPTVHDVISQSSIIAVVLVVLFIIIMASTFDPWFMPLFLLAGAGVIYLFANIKPRFDKRISKPEAGKISFWSLAGLGGLALIGVVSQGLFVGTIPASFLALAVTGSTVLFSAAMAVGETTMFQGALFSYFKRYGPYMAIAVTVGLGVIFHLRVYGTSSANLVYAGLGYGLLSWLTFKTGRLSVALIVHVANNLMASLLGPFMVLFLAAVAFTAYTSKKKMWRSVL